MRFIVSEQCQQLGLRAGAIVFRDVNVTSGCPELRARIIVEARSIQARFADAKAIHAAPEAVCFQEILRKVGVNPRREQSSVERLLSVAHKRGDLPAINSLVDAYNLVSIRTGCSLGAHDLDRIELPVSLRMLTGMESFTPLGRAAPVAVVAGEFGYVDAAKRVLCRLDVVQADFSKVTAQSRSVLLIVECTQAHAPEIIHQAFTETIEQVTRYCGGMAEIVAFPS
jgi:DNA/RNA-binding domain of Phe-tRNA-synthetase-like protein